MTTQKTSDAVQDTQTLTAPAGLNLMESASTGSCCGGSACGSAE